MWGNGGQDVAEGKGGFQTGRSRGRRGDFRQDAAEGEEGIPGGVFDVDFPKQPEGRGWYRTGRPIAPSMAR